MYFASPTPQQGNVFLPQIQRFFFLYCYYFPELPCTLIAENRTMKALSIDPLVLESPQKFFLRVKWKLQQQQKGTGYCS